MSVKRSLWFQHESSPAKYEEGSGQWLKATHLGSLTGSFRADCMAPSDAGSNSHLFLRGDSARLRSPPEDYVRRRDNRTDSCYRRQCQNIRALRRVPEN